MALDDDQKTNLRRHLGYPAVGLYRSSAAGGTLADGAASYRYHTAYGALEWRMNNLMPNEEARIVGSAYGAIAIMGTPQQGDQITLTISGGGLTAPETVGPLTVGPITHDVNRDQLGVTQLLTIAASQNANLIAANFLAVAPYGTGPFAERFYPNPIFALTNPAQFTMSVTASPSIGAQIRTQGKNLSPLYIQEKGTSRQVNIYGYLPILDVMEGDQAATTENLDTIQADVWHARATEIIERERLYMVWRRKLAKFLDLPLGEESGVTRASGGPLRLVV